MFLKSPAKSNKQKKHRNLQIESMEVRQMMAANLIASLSNGVLYIEGTNNADNITVRQVNGNISVAGINILQNGSYRSSVAASTVNQISVNGLGGNDSINLASEAYAGQQGINKTAIVHGGSGNDSIWGTIAKDYLYGDDGDDQLMGRNGNDYLDGGNGNDKEWGGAGNDTILGGAGNDQLMGDDGNDHLNGGAGADYLWGGNGDDVLITIDAAGTDKAQGDAGRDVMWIDSTGDTTPGADSSDRINRVASFANGADRTLNGDRIADPTLKSGAVYKQFAGNPLFSSSGPSRNDIRQGNLGDCYLLAGLSAIAMDNPHAVIEKVVDFDDGTYGVMFGSKFYRVDNDLAVTSSSSTTPTYAKLGAENSMWVAVVEKAFAHYRTGANSFASIESGWAVEINKAWGSTSAGAKDIQSYSSATALVNDMYAKWNTYQAVTIGFLNTKTASQASSSIINSHMYTVVSFNKNSSGVITSVVLRNPWGYDGAGSDSNTSDGLITVTPTQLRAYYGQVNWGKV